jgi:hypothetical protein
MDADLVVDSGAWERWKRLTGAVPRRPGNDGGGVYIDISIVINDSVHAGADIGERSRAQRVKREGYECWRRTRVPRNLCAVLVLRERLAYGWPGKLVCVKPKSNEEGGGMWLGEVSCDMTYTAVRATDFHNRRTEASFRRDWKTKCRTVSMGIRISGLCVKRLGGVLSADNHEHYLQMYIRMRIRRCEMQSIF